MAVDLGAQGQPAVPATRRGRHKVFLGMAAGVGKTYRMLQEGQAEAESGRDVVIGYLEPHERPETAAQAAGLEVVPRRRVVYRDMTLDEMDLPGVLARTPELCLVDELAHTNAPGLEHPKRYDDVVDVLAAGIDVFSTVNVQHLESLNDQVAELTGTRVRETLPDGVLGTADEIVLVDLTPEALIQRLRAGKIYPGERVDAALNGFFKLENLAALREVALRQVAEDVEAKRLTSEALAPRDDEGMLERAAPQAVGERLLALVKPTPKSQRVVRRAWRSAQRLQAELDILWVAPHEPTAEEREQLDALRRLATLLGAHLLV
jgi:two-component system sensor histidine kinase KdpD